MNKFYDLANVKGIYPTYGMGPIPVGIIPDGCTQVVKSGVIANAALVVHTVTAAKTLYLTNFSFSTYNTSGASQTGYLYVQNSVPVVQYTMVAVMTPNNDGKAVADQLLPPLEIPAGWQIVILSGAANFNVNAFIHGYEV